MRSQLLKQFDAIAGPLLVRLFKDAGSGATRLSPSSALFIRPGGIGDAVLLVPAIKALQRAHPGCAIDILADSRNASLFGLVPGIRNVYKYHTLAGLGAALTGRYHLVIDTEQWYRLSAVVARLTRAPMLIGFATNERERMFTHRICYSQEEYEARSFFKLLEPLGVSAPIDISTPFLFLPAAATESAEGLLAPLSGEPFITVFPGASVPQKQWGIENFRALADEFASKGMSLVIVGGEDTQTAGEEIARGGLALNLAGKASLAETAALIGKGRVLVSGDSGLLHIAAGLGTPTVSLFGPSDPRKWGPKGEQHQVFSLESSCAPCSRFGTIPPCADSVRCLSLITVAEVVAAVERSFGREAG